ncbi:CIS tube protein [Microscilla marina]|uniref:LysM domain-containing protein n=1 Tax=Microscilla marina ATCC 23134 TaxID=313606 RepID=A1ZC09_MICM2|nr:hypothetical protein [Microscilla marina]EAY31811.1 conserved hypothetical protein [Microscilla marina ATCC 23134]
MADKPNILKLDHLKIESYEDAARTKKLANQNVFDRPVSVKDFSQFYGTRYRQKKGLGLNKKKTPDTSTTKGDKKTLSAAKNQVVGSEKPHLKFDIVLDNTVVFRSDMGYKQSVSVVAQVNEFLETCYKSDKVTPYYLKITWGESTFDCVLQTSAITYSLFDRSGTPLRAKITATFLVENVEGEPSERAGKAQVNKQHSVKKGDSLPMIAVAAYGSLAFLLPLARYNGVKHLREVKPGTTLDLPTLDELKNFFI